MVLKQKSYDLNPLFLLAYEHKWFRNRIFRRFYQWFWRFCWRVTHNGPLESAWRHLDDAQRRRLQASTSLWLMWQQGRFEVPYGDGSGFVARDEICDVGSVAMVQQMHDSLNNFAA